MIAPRLLSDVDTQLLIRAARPGRDRLMLEIAYFGALRVSELAGLTWSQIIPRETGEAQLAIVGKGDKPRNTPHQLHRQGRGPANGHQSCGLRALVAPCARQPRDRRGRADYTRFANARARGLEDHKHLRARQAERQLEPLTQEALTPHREPQRPWGVVRHRRGRAVRVDTNPVRRSAPMVLLPHDRPQQNRTRRNIASIWRGRPAFPRSVTRSVPAAAGELPWGRCWTRVCRF